MTNLFGPTYGGAAKFEQETDYASPDAIRTEFARVVESHKSDLRRIVDLEARWANFETDPAVYIAHTLFDAGIHTDTVTNEVSAGSIIYGNATPAWDELVISIPSSSGLRNVLAIDNGETLPTWQANNAISVALPIIGSPTYTNVEEMNILFHSAGWFSGGVISNAGSATIDVTAGTGAIRATDSAVAQLLFFDWPASNGLAITANSIRYIGVELNDPNDPQVVVRTSDNFDHTTDFPLGTVVNESGTLHIQNAPWEIGDHANAMIRRARGTMPIARDKEVGGIIFSETGTRNVVVSAGQLWRGLTAFVIGALDTDPGGAADTFDEYSSQGKENTGTAAWPNTLYDNGTGGTGTLQTVGNNKWANLWWYIELDGELVMVYGSNHYATQAQAEQEASPSTLPNRLQVHGILAARFIFQKSAATAAEILSAFDTTFITEGVTDHGNLAGLSDDDHSIYALLAGRSGGQTLQGGTGSGEDITVRGNSNGLNGSVFLGSSAKFELDETAGQLKLPTTGSGGGTVWGGDAQWYRGATNQLRTPDNVIVDLNLDVTGHAIIGATAGPHSADLILEVQETISDASNGSTQVGIQGSLTGDGTGTTRSLNGLQFTVFHSLDNAATLVRGLHTQTIINGSVGGTDLMGGEININTLSGAANFTRAAGLYVSSSRIGTHTADTVWGLRLDDFSAWGTTSDTVYSIQIDALDASANATRWAFFYGDVGSGLFTIDEEGDMTGTVIHLVERADAKADVEAQGQLWVNTATPNELYFTTDAGNDREIAYAGGAFHDGFSDFVGSEHVAEASIDHGTIAGLADDDHTQYHKSAGDTGTGVHDFGGATSFEIPNSATPTVDADGEIALDTTITDFSTGLIRYYGGEAMVIIAVPAAEIDTAPTDGHVLAYNATNDEFEFVAGGGGGNHAILDGSVHDDSVADAVTRGSIIYGNSTPKWDELVIGSAGAALTSDGTDASWVVASRTIVLTALNGNPTTTAGCGGPIRVEAGTNDVDYWVLDFDTGTDENAFWVFAMPDNYDGGTITFRPYWTAASGSGTVVFKLMGRAYANSDAIDAAYTDIGETSTDTLLTAGDVHIGPESSAITLNGGPAGGEMVQVKLTRDVSADSLGVDARLMMLMITYGTSSYSD